MSFNLATILSESAAADPDKPLALMGDLTITYRQFDEASGRVAASLRAMGLRPGAPVAVQLPNVPQFITAYFGVLKAGLVMVPLNPLLRTPEIAYHLEDSGASVLVTFESFAAEALAGADAAPQDVTTFVVTVSEPAARPEGTRHFDELYQTPDGPVPDEGILEPTTADSTAVLLYTSGTTGRPKGAELTHFQLYMAASVGGELFGYRPDDITMGVLPFFHVFGLGVVINTGVRHAGTIVLVPRFSADAVLDAMARHRVTVFAGVPTMFIALLGADPGDRDLASLRVCISGGAAIAGEVIKAFETRYPGAPILEGYGLSETAAIATFNRSVDERRPTSIGKPMWGVQVRIADDEGAAVPDGTVGEILLRGHNVMKGYHGRPEATAEAMAGGWFHTGDMAYRDADGYYFIVDRKKDLIIRGGYNVYPREIEEVLYGHPSVIEAAVVGRADERLGEEVVAFVAVRDATSGEELVAYCKEQLAAYKYPRRVTLVDTLPKGPTGKILKTELRKI